MSSAGIFAAAVLAVNGFIVVGIVTLSGKPDPRRAMEAHGAAAASPAEEATTTPRP